MEQKPHHFLWELSNFIRQNATFTSHVVKILEAECKEAQFALKPWEFETIVTRKIERGRECICNIEKVEDEQVEEIATGISRALLQAQQLREKLSCNVAMERKQVKPKATTNKQSDNNNSSKSAKSPLPPTNTQQQSKGAAKKNYIMINKMMVKGAKKPMKTETTKTTTPLKSIFCEKTIEKLVEKITEKDDGIVTYSDNCPIHGSGITSDDVDREYTEKVVDSIDVIEGLDKFGIPSEMLETLKLYHKLLAHLQPKKEGVETKADKAKQHFLAEFNAMNDGKMQQRASKSDQRLMNQLQNSLTNLSTSVNPIAESNNESNDNKRISMRPLPAWNCTALNSSYGNALVTRYSSGEDLLSLYEITKETQQTQYLNSLIDIILEQVLPHFTRNKLPPAKSEDISQVYKMISTILQVVNLRSTVLIVNNED